VHFSSFCGRGSWLFQYSPVLYRPKYPNQANRKIRQALVRGIEVVSCYRFAQTKSERGRTFHLMPMLTVLATITTTPRGLVGAWQWRDWNALVSKFCLKHGFSFLRALTTLMCGGTPWSCGG
jgi:hypothetical protein